MKPKPGQIYTDPTDDAFKFVVMSGDVEMWSEGKVVWKVGCFQKIGSSEYFGAHFRPFGEEDFEQLKLTGTI